MIGYVSGDDNSVEFSSSYSSGLALQNTAYIDSGTGNQVAIDTGVIGRALFSGSIGGTVSAAADAIATVNVGSGDVSFSAAAGDTATVNDGSGAVSFSVAAGDTASISVGSGGVVTPSGGDTDFSLSGSGGGEVNISNADLTIGGSLTVDGSSNDMTSSGGDLTLIGSSNALTLDESAGAIINSNSISITLDGHDDVTINGNDNPISDTGVGEDGLSITGTDDPVYDTDSTINYSGDNTGDDVTGSGNGGAGWANEPHDPILLNLNGGSVETESYTNSNAYFDIQNTGQAVETGWATAGEGVLVYDPNNTDTASSALNLVGGMDALQALAESTDGTSDPTLTASDALWSQLKVWVDPTGTANPQDGQFYTLDQLGITSLNLSGTTVNQANNGNTIIEDSSFTYANGTTGDMAGVALQYDPAITSQTNALVAAMAGSGTNSASTSGSSSTGTDAEHPLAAATS